MFSTQNGPTFSMSRTIAPAGSSRREPVKQQSQGNQRLYAITSRLACSSTSRASALVYERTLIFGFAENFTLAVGFSVRYSFSKAKFDRIRRKSRLDLTVFGASGSPFGPFSLSRRWVIQVSTCSRVNSVRSSIPVISVIRRIIFRAVYSLLADLPRHCAHSRIKSLPAGSG